MTRTRTTVAELPGQVSLFPRDAHAITIQLAGLSHDSRHFNALRAAKKDALKAVTVRREPENEHDPNAIRVRAYLKGNERLDLGYVPAKRAVDLAPLMDAGTFIRADVTSYRAWRPDKKNKNRVVAELTLRWNERS